ncbi:MFS family transporter [Sphingomonas echinoides]|uniref:MFS family transporter n=1 Tax=Sphingomonas echinoides TaxID=59803 RepID=UPI0024130F5C|nr:MFS family transporter [Sphingomonas echinoides]
MTLAQPDRAPAAPASSGSTAELSTAARARAIVAGSMGNLIEWYDFYVYAFTALYFSAEFFPTGDRTAQLLGTSGIFAVGFLLRPLGGWYFGRFADQHGRRRAMVVSIILMGIGSALIASLPTYATIGAFAPALLLLGRMIQGFSTGGQYGTAATYLSEIAFTGRRGFFASFQYVTLIGGQLLALAVILILQQVLSTEEMRAFGWRIPFAIGAVAALTILLFRHVLHETTNTGAKHPDAGTLRGLIPHWRAFLTVLGLTAGGSLMFYVFSTYMQKYLVNTAHMDAKSANWVMTAVLIPFALLQPVFGLLSDRIGRRTNMLLFGALATLATVPLLSLLANVQSAGAAFALVLAGLAINSLYTSISGLFKAELFPVHVRALGVSLAYGIGNALFGGSAEYVALSFKAAGNESGFYWYVTAICAVAFVTAVLMRTNHDQDPLDDAR